MKQLLGSVPPAFEEELLDKYREIERNFRESRWEPAELNGGKFCEVVYCIIRGHVDGSYPHKLSKPSNFYDSCLKMEKESSTFGRSIRIQIPRMLAALYEIRNNRNVGHIGGDVNPNHMDAVFVLQSAKWILAELVRIFHGVSLPEATAIVETLTERQMPLVWDTGTIRRVLDTGLSMLEKTLVLLFGSTLPMPESELVASLEHSNPSVYRRDILRRAHSQRLIEYSSDTKLVQISPLGIKRVEDKILPKASP